ncbi:MAG: D-isomer specific 2-hydroxyacid dehydrogenase family protein [Mycobacteriales bacterium]
MTPGIAILPSGSEPMAAAVQAGGGKVVGISDRPDALVWMAPRDSAGLREALQAAPSARWVQLPFAGVEDFVDVLEPSRTWTCAKGVYAEPTAEHALALALAGLRRLPARARATSWGEQDALSLFDAPVVVLGGGGITQSLLSLLSPFRCRVTVVRRSAEPVPGAARTVPVEMLDEVLPDARLVVLALALTPETTHVIGARQLAAMSSSAWLVNIARGRHVDTDALVTALRERSIGGAAIDVTDPEPLPDGHPLWTLPNCLITPHTANPWQTAQPLLAQRVTDNVRRFGSGEPLLGLVDRTAGY